MKQSQVMLILNQLLTLSESNFVELVKKKVNKLLPKN